jgi:hypothetical protein
LPRSGATTSKASLTHCSNDENLPPPANCLVVDGIGQYAEIPDSPDFGVGVEGLTVAAWMRPDTMTFPQDEGEHYVHWLGKGEGVGSAGQQEWVLRLYGDDNVGGRAGWISFYLYSPAGGQGIGSHATDPTIAGEWVHIVGVATDRETQIYRNGEMKDHDIYAGKIIPTHGSAPLRLGTRDFRSYFQGALAQVRIWNVALSPDQVQGLYASNIVAAAGLVAEYLLDGTIAYDSTAAHNGRIYGANWGIG